jgi:riboflavin synthase
MFTGLVEGTGVVTRARKIGEEMDLEVDLGSFAEGLRTGGSVSLSGVCCTVTSLTGGRASFHLAPETLRRTWLGELEVGDRVNIERPLRLGDELGGHLVQGHVDGVGRILEPVDAEGGGELEIRVPAALTSYCVEKGSLAVDGISLTIARVRGDQVGIAIIPHTARVTTLGGRPAGSPLNLEVDVLGKYVEKIVESVVEERVEKALAARLRAAGPEVRRRP